MQKLQILSLVLFALTLSFFGCKDDDDENPRVESCTLSYGDTLFFYKDNDYIISPQLVPDSLKGTYVSYPEGLDISSRTGKINVSNSEGGQRYFINFISDRNVVCETSLIISGIDYLDSIYDLDKGEAIAQAIYNTVADLQLPERSVIDTVRNPNDTPASEFGLVIERETGAIDLRQTILNGFLGDPETLEGGESREIEVDYFISDQSSTINTELVRIYYYKTREDIPEWLIEQIEEQRYYKDRFGKGKIMPRQPGIVVTVGDY